MSQPGTIIYGLAPRIQLVVTAGDVEAALSHALLIAKNQGWSAPAELSCVITEDPIEPKSELWSDVTHEEAIRWILGEAHRQTLVAMQVRS